MLYLIHFVHLTLNWGTKTFEGRLKQFLGRFETPKLLLQMFTYFCAVQVMIPRVLFGTRVRDVLHVSQGHGGGCTSGGGCQRPGRQLVLVVPVERERDDRIPVVIRTGKGQGRLRRRSDHRRLVVFGGKWRAGLRAVDRNDCGGGPGRRAAPVLVVVVRLTEGRSVGGRPRCATAAVVRCGRRRSLIFRRLVQQRFESGAVVPPLWLLLQLQPHLLLFHAHCGVGDGAPVSRARSESP